MSVTSIENQLRIANEELNRRIALLEEKLRKKNDAGTALRDSEKRYRRLFESAKDGILILDAETGRVVDVNPFLMELLGYSYDALCGRSIWELGVFKDIAASRDAFKVLQEHEYVRYEDLPLESSNGKPIAVEFVSNVYLVDGAKVIQCNIRDITERKRASAEHKRLMAAIEQVGEGIVMTDAKGIILFVNPAFEKMTGYSRVEAVGRNPRLLKSGSQDELFYRHLWKVVSSGKTWAGRMVNKRKDGTLYTEDSTISPVCDASGRIVNYVAVKRDITEPLRLAAQFQQAQKMEAVGHLAGGVAHDYNNMLSVILGYAELALEKAGPGHPLQAYLEAIFKAAGRSADITRQLLAFARKQTITPVALDLNLSIERMLKMLRRLIGEDINLTWAPGANLCPIRMDPSQLDQILANLCVNARDAIAGVGKIAIETDRVDFDEAFCDGHAGFTPGAFVRLTVSDDGCGMDKEIQDRLFEPFFTTKGAGKGTGLGLSTVYGIVKQNDGFINVYSEPGKGAIFRIYLPRHEGDTVDPRTERPAKPPRGRGETILVVEDEIAILKLSGTMLENLGYVVLTAGTTDEAIRLAKAHAAEVRLLITDVIMPENNGRELAERLMGVDPNLKVLFMSGYTADVIARRGVLDKGMSFIQKPFCMKDLAVKVHDALGRG